jgi:thioredoxin domain-containing protein 5
MADTWTELANVYNRYNNIVIAEVDCTKFGLICQKHEIRGYPSLVMFENGEQVEKYSGQRDLENFSNFIKKYLTKYHDEL